MLFSIHLCLALPPFPFFCQHMKPVDHISLFLAVNAHIWQSLSLVSVYQPTEILCWVRMTVNGCTLWHRLLFTAAVIPCLAAAATMCTVAAASKETHLGECSHAASLLCRSSVPVVWAAGRWVWTCVVVIVPLSTDLSNSSSACLLFMWETVHC